MFNCTPATPPPAPKNAVRAWIRALQSDTSGEDEILTHVLSNIDTTSLHTIANVAVQLITMALHCEKKAMVSPAVKNPRCLIWLKTALSLFLEHQHTGDKIERAADFKIAARRLVYTIYKVNTFPSSFLVNSNRGAFTFVAMHAYPLTAAIMDEICALPSDELTHLPRLKSLSCHVDYLHNKPDLFVLGDDTSAVRKLLAYQYPAYWRILVANPDGEDGFIKIEINTADNDEQCDSDKHFFQTDVATRLLKLEIAAKIANDVYLQRACILTLSEMSDVEENDLVALRMNCLFLSALAAQINEPRHQLDVQHRYRAGIYVHMAIDRRTSHLVPIRECLTTARSKTLRSLSIQTLYMHFTSVFGEDNAMVECEATINQLLEETTPELELKYLGLVACQLINLEKEDEIAMFWAKIYASVLQHLRLDHIRSVLCFVMRESASFDDADGPFRDAYTRFPTVWHRAISQFVDDHPLNPKDELLSIAPILAYQGRVSEELVERVNLLFRNQSKLSETQLRCVRSWMGTPADDPPSPPSPLPLTKKQLKKARRKEAKRAMSSEECNVSPVIVDDQEEDSVVAEEEDTHGEAAEDVIEEQLTHTVDLVNPLSAWTVVSKCGGTSGPSNAGKYRPNVIPMHRMPPLCDRGANCRGYGCMFVHLPSDLYNEFDSFTEEDATAYSKRIDIGIARRQQKEGGRNRLEVHNGVLGVHVGADEPRHLCSQLQLGNVARKRCRKQHEVHTRCMGAVEERGRDRPAFRLVGDLVDLVDDEDGLLTQRCLGLLGKQPLEEPSGTEARQDRVRDKQQVRIARRDLALVLLMELDTVGKRLL